VRRRDALKAVACSAGLVAGCLGSGSSAPRSKGRVSVDADGAYDDYGFEVEPSVVAAPSDDNPATVRIELTNTAAGREILFGQPAPVQGGTARNGSQVAMLIDEDENGLGPTEENHYIPEELTGGCWVAKSSRLSFNAVGNPIHLGSGESVSNDYVLLLEPRSPCPIEGTFEFAFEVPGERARNRVTNTDGYVVEYDNATWTLRITFDPVGDGTGSATG